MLVGGRTKLRPWRLYPYAAVGVLIGGALASAGLTAMLDGRPALLVLAAIGMVLFAWSVWMAVGLTVTIDERGMSFRKPLLRRRISWESVIAAEPVEAPFVFFANGLGSNVIRLTLVGRTVTLWRLAGEVVDHSNRPTGLVDTAELLMTWKRAFGGSTDPRTPNAKRGGTPSQ